MVRLVSMVLHEIRGDVVLTFAGEIVWLLRKGGQQLSRKSRHFEFDVQESTISVTRYDFIQER